MVKQSIPKPQVGGRYFTPVSLTWDYKMVTHRGTQTGPPHQRDLLCCHTHIQSRHHTCKIHRDQINEKGIHRRYTFRPITQIRTLGTDMECTYQYRTHTNTCICHLQRHDLQFRCKRPKNDIDTWVYYSIPKEYFTIVSPHTIHTTLIYTHNAFTHIRYTQ